MIEFIRQVGWAQILTLIFIILKLCGAITWSWWWVLFPTLLWVSVFILWIVLAGISMIIFGAMMNQWSK